MQKTTHLPADPLKDPLNLDFFLNPRQIVDFNLKSNLQLLDRFNFFSFCRHKNQFYSIFLDLKIIAVKY